MADSNLWLHRVVSNSTQVIDTFPEEDHYKDLKVLDLSVHPLPLQRGSGLSWNLETDTSTYQVSQEVKLYTRRGILSTLNSLYDPLGFVAPVILQGKALG